MTIILKPFSAPTVQFPKKEKPPILNPIPPLSFYFIGIISISSMRVLFQPPILLALFWTNLLCWLNAISYCYSIYCVYLFAATALSIWCITHLYIDYLSAPLDQIHLSYTLHSWWCSTLPILFSGSLKSRDFLCVAGDLSHEATRGVSKILYDVISSTQIPIYNANNNDELMLHFLYTDHLPDILSKPIFLNIILLSWLCVISKNKLLGRY